MINSRFSLGRINIGACRRANSRYISARVFSGRNATEENTVRWIVRVISLRIFLGIPDRSGRWVKFERVQRAVIRDETRVIRRQRVGDSWHNARANSSRA